MRQAWRLSNHPRPPTQPPSRLSAPIAGCAARRPRRSDFLSDAALAAVEALLLKQEPWRLEFLKAEEGVGEADANNRRRRAAKGHAKEEREERAELAPFGEDYGSGGLNRAEIDLFDDDGL